MQKMFKECKDSDVSIDDWIQENGFIETGGMVYASYEEFLNNEYQDSDYMQRILSAEQYANWCSEKEYATVLITAYPYVSQTGSLYVPRKLLGDKNKLTCYIGEHLSEMSIEDTDFNYVGTDFEFEVEE